LPAPLILLFLFQPLAADPPPAGFRAIFDGKSLEGWHGRPHFSPLKLAK
jgi:hypothetical protein